MSTLQKLTVAIVVAIVAAYPVQKVVVQSWDAPRVVVWAIWLALTLGIWLAIRTALARRRRDVE